MSDLQAYLKTAIRAAEAAGRIQQFYVNTNYKVETKSSETDLVTEVDKKCEQTIREIILGAYPGHSVLGEEYGQPGGANTHRWIVDPIDGTLNFAHGFPFYCVSIALEIDGVLQVGVVFDSVRNELFTATRGGGAFLNGSPIEVTKETTLRNAMMATGFAYSAESASENIEIFARMLPKVRSVRRPGAAALDLCYVACGRLDGFWELKLNAWDVAAGILLIQEAGGTITGAAGEPYHLNNPIVVVSNGHLHGKIIHALELQNAYA